MIHINVNNVNKIITIYMIINVLNHVKNKIIYLFHQYNLYALIIVGLKMK